MIKSWLRWVMYVLPISLSYFGHAQEKPLLIVTTDIGQDPDDLQSMIRLLHYANEFEIVGLIANADSNYDHEAPIIQDSLLHKCIRAYDLIDENLRQHGADYPTGDHLRDQIKRGCAGNGTRQDLDDYVGLHKDTEGSNHIVQTVAKAKRPVHVSVWGGGADLAQALWKVRTKCGPEQLGMFVHKLRVYFVGKQDSSVDWIIKEFPDLWAVVSFDREGDKWESAYRGMFYGGDMSTTDQAWLKENVLPANPLAAMYPLKAYTGGELRNPNGALKEGDTPSWFYFLENGLNIPDDPSAGGWGGRFEEVKPMLYFDAADAVYDESIDSTVVSARATVFRWRDDFQNDFAARVHWGSKEHTNANHPPVVHIKNFPEDELIWTRSCMAGNIVRIDASESQDPDNDDLSFECILYGEAGNYPHVNKVIVTQESPGVIDIAVPQNARGRTIHAVIKVSDQGSPTLSSYRRVILNAE